MRSSSRLASRKAEEENLHVLAIAALKKKKGDRVTLLCWSRMLPSLVYEAEDRARMQ